MFIGPAAPPYPGSKDFPIEIDNRKNELKFDSIEVTRRAPKIKIFTGAIESVSDEEYLESRVNEFLKNMTEADPIFELVDIKSSVETPSHTRLITYTVIYRSK